MLFTFFYSLLLSCVFFAVALVHSSFCFSFLNVLLLWCRLPLQLFIGILEIPYPCVCVRALAFSSPVSSSSFFSFFVYLLLLSILFIVSSVSVCADPRTECVYANCLLTVVISFFKLHPKECFFFHSVCLFRICLVWPLFVHSLCVCVSAKQTVQLLCVFRLPLLIAFDIDCCCLYTSIFTHFRPFDHFASSQYLFLFICLFVYLPFYCFDSQ